jgi:uncharacterized protein YcbX
MPRTITALNRYPVKGLGAQALAQVRLEPGEGFPKDRCWALGNGRHDAAHYTAQPRPKTDFLMLLEFESLASLGTRFEDEGNRLTLTLSGRAVYHGSLDAGDDVRRLEDFMVEYLGGKIAGRPMLLSQRGRRYTDVSVRSDALMNAVSLINLASVDALGQTIGQAVDPLSSAAT